MIKVLQGEATMLTITVDHRWRAAPTAATWSARLPGGGDFSTPAAATVDDADEAVAAYAPAGQDFLVFDAAPAFTPGRRYLVVDAGRSFVVEVAAIVDERAYLADPLLADVPQDARVLGQSIVFTLPASTATGEGLVRLAATVGGAPRSIAEGLRVQRYMVPIPFDARDLLAQWPRVRDMREATDTPLSNAIQAGWEMLVTELNRKKIYEDRIRSSGALRQPAMMATYLHLMENASPDNVEMLTLWRGHLARAIDSAIASIDFWYDKEEADKPRPDPERVTLRETLSITR